MTHTKVILAMLMLSASFFFVTGCYTTVGMPHPSEVVVERPLDPELGRVVTTTYVWEDADPWYEWPDVHVVELYPTRPIFYDPDLYIAIGCWWTYSVRPRPIIFGPPPVWYGPGFYDYHPHHHPYSHPVFDPHPNYHGHAWPVFAVNHPAKDPGTIRPFTKKPHTVPNTSRPVAAHAPAQTQSGIRHTSVIAKTPQPQTQRLQETAPIKRNTTVPASSSATTESRSQITKSVKQEVKTTTRPQTENQPRPSATISRSQSPSFVRKNNEPRSSLQKQDVQKSTSIQKQSDSKIEKTRTAPSCPEKAVSRPSGTNATVQKKEAPRNASSGTSDKSEKKAERNRIVKRSR